MICRNCSAEIDDNSKKCPSCGKDPKKRNSGSKAGTLLTILLILSLGVNSYFISANFDEIKKRAEPLFASISQSVSSLFKNGSSETTSAQTEPEETSPASSTETESSATETTEKTSESETAAETSAQTSAKEEETSAAKKPKAEKETSKAASSKAASSKPQSTKESSDSLETVYVTASGKRYHRKNCSYISNSTSKRGISLKEAAREGYSACSRCKP